MVKHLARPRLQVIANPGVKTFRAASRCVCRPVLSVLSIYKRASGIAHPAVAPAAATSADSSSSLGTNCVVHFNSGRTRPGIGFG